MHDVIITNLKKNSSYSLVNQLKEQFHGTYDLIINHEWVLDLLNSKLTLEQFKSFIAQEAYLYDFLSRKVVSLALRQSDNDYDNLMRVGLFLYSESYSNRKPFIHSNKVYLSCPTQSYRDELSRVWHTSPSTNDMQKLLTILSTLWIREGLYHLLKNELSYNSEFKEWTDRIARTNPQEFIHSISTIMNQAFERLYGNDESSSAYQQGISDMELLLSTLTKFELLVRNHAYQSHNPAEGE